MSLVGVDSFQTGKLPRIGRACHVSYSLNSLKGGHIGDHMGDYYRGYQGGS